MSALVKTVINIIVFNNAKGFTYWDKMVVISMWHFQTYFLVCEIVLFWFHWSLFPGVQLTKPQWWPCFLICATQRVNVWPEDDLLNYLDIFIPHVVVRFKLEFLLLLPIFMTFYCTPQHEIAGINFLTHQGWVMHICFSKPLYHSFI